MTQQGFSFCRKVWNFAATPYQRHDTTEALRHAARRSALRREKTKRIGDLSPFRRSNIARGGIAYPMRLSCGTTACPTRYTIEFSGMAEGEIYEGAASRESSAQSGRQDRRAKLWAVCSRKARSGLKRMRMRKVSLGLLLYFMDRSVMAIAISDVVAIIISAVISVIPNKRLIGYSCFEQLKDLIP